MVSFKTFGWRIVELFVAEQQDKMSYASNDQSVSAIFVLVRHWVGWCKMWNHG
jgi:hypothetical protein